MPAWAGENGPECFILLNKRHDDASCRVQRGPGRSPLRLSSALICFFFILPPRLWFAAGGEVLLPQLLFWRFSVVFTALLAASRHRCHCSVSANRGQECYAAWSKHLTMTTSCCTEMWGANPETRNARLRTPNRHTNTPPLKHWGFYYFDYY